jgi:hypothetical protein
MFNNLIRAFLRLAESELVMKYVTDEASRELVQYIIDNLDDYKGQDLEACDLHNELFNTDYYIIGYANAEEFLDKYGTFTAINEIKEYEQDNFGEVNTNFSDSEKVANMFAYIKGEDILNTSQVMQDRWNEKLSNSDLQALKEELEELL